MRNTVYNGQKGSSASNNRKIAFLSEIFPIFGTPAGALSFFVAFVYFSLIRAQNGEGLA